jgi:hypothetical protein
VRNVEELLGDLSGIVFLGIVGFRDISISLRVVTPFMADKNLREKHESEEAL